MYLSGQEYDAVFGPGGAVDPTSGVPLVAAKRPGLDLVVACRRPAHHRLVRSALAWGFRQWCRGGTERQATADGWLRLGACQVGGGQSDGASAGAVCAADGEGPNDGGAVAPVEGDGDVPAGGGLVPGDSLGGVGYVAA